MIKKFLALPLCFALAIAFTSCSASTDKPSSIPAPDDGAPTTEASAPEYPGEDDTQGEEHNPNYVDFPKFSEERNEDLIAAFTPADATLHSDVAGSLICESTLPFADLIDFYKSAAEVYGVVESSVDESTDGMWSYVGTYDSGKMLTVNLRDYVTNVSIIITY